MNAITTIDLSKHYRGAAALSHVTLQVPQGKAYACVGHAGSGKTTLLRLLSGLYRPGAGECTVMGCNPFFEADKLHAICGTVLESAGLYQTMTVSENLHFFARLNETDENDSIDRISFLLHRLDVWESRDCKVSELTTGVLQRVSLARALLHSSQVLLMDAPPFGYNRETGEAIRDLITHLVSEEGMTVLFCAEDMNYAASLCEGFFLLHNGQLIARGDLESLRQGAGVACRALLRLGDEETPPDGFTLTEHGWQKNIKDEAELPQLIFSLAAEGKHIYEARVITPDLSEIYDACLLGGIHRVGDSHEQTAARTERETQHTQSREGRPLPQSDETEQHDPPQEEGTL